ncbi:MAG: bifunctional sugar phosphate isomerase/epimerase/4-hydroxyphenylpyruvate dioxygenase family protein [Acetobacteraceae bacterium]
MGDAPPLLKSIATVSLSGSLPEKLEAAAAIGFDGIELFEQDLLTFDGSPDDVRYIAEGLGLAITCYQPFRDFEALPDAQRSRALDRAARKFDVMQALGCDLLLVCSNTLTSCLDDDARAAADLVALAERAGERGLRVGYEALAWGRHVRTWDHAWSIVQQGGHASLGLVVDSFHTLAIGDDFAGISAVPAAKLFLVQLADAPKLTLDPLSWSRHFRSFPGQGELPVAAFLRAVLATGYTGSVSLEVFNDEFRIAPARLVARDGLRALRLVEAEADHTSLPPPPVLAGTEFLEFAVDDESRRRLGEVLRALGFHYAGRHRSKDVDLFRQGDISLILNAEPDSAAAEHFQFHGTSVCAMGLRIDNAARACDRADALLCPQWQEAVGPGEQPLPAVRAPDGTLVFLIAPSADGRSIYDSDFRLFGDPAPPPQLTAVDHIAQALPAGRMDNFTLFYRAIFGLEAEPTWEIADPYGLVRSRTMTSPNGTVRLPLNISEGRATGTGRFVSAHGGAGVQHIAFASPDIGQTLAVVRARGARLLSVPANYYDDIAARWDLDADRIAWLRERNLLYDRDEHGEFLHAYTETFDGRFFFEIVQRIGAYRGYGAVNASIRMAAQRTAERAG